MAPLRSSCERCGPLGSSWGPLGSLWSHPGPLLGSSWVPPGALGDKRARADKTPVLTARTSALQGPVCADWELSWIHLGAHRAFPGATLRPSEGPSWGPPGALGDKRARAVKAPVLTARASALLGPFWSPVEVLLDPSWAPLGSLWCHPEPRLGHLGALALRLVVRFVRIPPAIALRPRGGERAFVRIR